MSWMMEFNKSTLEVPAREDSDSLQYVQEPPEEVEPVRGVRVGQEAEQEVGQGELTVVMGPVVVVADEDFEEDPEEYPDTPEAVPNAEEDPEEYPPILETSPREELAEPAREVGQEEPLGEDPEGVEMEEEEMEDGIEEQEEDEGARDPWEVAVAAVKVVATEEGGQDLG